MSLSKEFGIRNNMRRPHTARREARETIVSMVSAVPIGDVLLFTINGVAAWLANTRATSPAAARM